MKGRSEGEGAALLQVVDLATSFATPVGTVEAVTGVSFTLDRGRALGVVGESGSGKTVLARSIMNLLPKPAQVRGSVLLSGRPVLGLPAREMRQLWGREMAMVFQDPATSLNPVVKIGRQLTESLRHHMGLRPQAARAVALELLESVGLPAPERRLRQYPHQLSGGMRQRVTIAIALACGPRLLVADEPTTALDVTVQRQILDLLSALRRERDMGLVLITHDLAVVANYTDEVIVMYAGQVVERAPTATLFGRMRHPYSEALLAAVPRLDDGGGPALRAIPGRPPDATRLPRGCRFAPRCRYAQARCLAEVPPLRRDPTPAGEHGYRCFYPVGTAAGAEALQRNQAAGATAAGTPLPAEGAVGQDDGVGV